MIIQDDILVWANEYTGPKFHAAFGDPPYGLNENEIDIQAVLADWMAGREHRPKGSGFMGREWDAFLPGPAVWAAIRRHCHPGALLFAFGGTRTADLLGIAIRLAGWEKIDEIEYVYAVGFPKNHNLGKAQDNRAFHTWLKAHPQERELLRVMRRAGKRDPIDKKAAQGYERELRERAGLAPVVISQRRHQPKFDAAGFEYRQKDNGYNSKDRAMFDVTAPASEQGQIWDGYGTALKPAHEPILVFRNPFRGTYAENCERTGAGALNIAGGRIKHDEDCRPIRAQYSEGEHCDFYRQAGRHGETLKLKPEGRWPANLILAHSFACADTCVPGCPVTALDSQSGEKSSGGYPARHGVKDEGVYGRFQGAPTGRDGDLRSIGGASRYFFQADWSLDRLETADPIAYYSKACKSEREAGLDPMHIRLLQEAFGDDDFSENTIDDGRLTSIDNPYQRGETKRRNIHPCVKPLSLTIYLATLLAPPDAYAPRRILVPFSGSGSEYLGALLSGHWEEIVGVELDEAYVKIANARISYWESMRHKVTPGEGVKVKLQKSVESGQLEMF